MHSGKSISCILVGLAGLGLALATACSDDDSAGGGTLTLSDGGSIAIPDGGSVAVDGGCADSDAGCRITFASGPDWDSYGGDLGGADGGTLGPAKLVCLSASSPAGCSASAFNEGSSGTGWTATSSLAPAAQWIWRGDIATGQTSDLVFAVFQKHFTLGASPAGNVQIAADDFVEVLVNGLSVGTNGSITVEADAFTAQSTARTFDISSKLVPGDNVITIVAQNGPATFAGCNGSCTYALNTAGTLFGGVLVSH